jgi:ABC-type uncharacterized transport system ATPase subunit
VEAGYELELRGITKRYPGVVANDGVDLSVRRGEIHAIVGENGAGKTTLMSVLYGLIHPDAGSIAIRGEEVQFRSSQEAIDAGLGMVHQHFKLFPSLSVAENIVFGAEPGQGLVVDLDAAVAQVEALAEEYGLPVDPTAKVEDLAVGVRQRVEILKALYRKAKILILDEPTAVLTPQERDSLFEVLERLCVTGHTALLITHKLGEVMAVSQHVTVLRRGKSVADLVTANTSTNEMSQFMTGRDVDLAVAPPALDPGAAVLEIANLHVRGVHGTAAVDGVSFDVRAGEIVTIAGVAGNGQAELLEAIAGLRDVEAGEIRLSGRDITAASVGDRRSGLSYIPEDRRRTGTAGAASIWENLMMGFQHQMASGPWLDKAAIENHADELIAEYDIRVAGPAERVDSLSGGNLQKLVVARELARESALIVADQPIRGVDIGATAFIHNQLTTARDRGAGILLVSSELWEVLSLSTRILVMYEGTIVGELDPAETNETEIGLYMSGVTS